MKPFRCTAFLLATAILAACGIAEKKRDAFQAEMSAFVGRSADEVIKAKGVPTATATLSNGGRVLEYYSSKMVTSGGGSHVTYQNVYRTNSLGTGGYTQVPVQQTAPITTTELRCKILFVVSRNGLVDSWKAEGNNCY
jgi:hypothetical protein